MLPFGEESFRSLNITDIKAENIKKILALLRYSTGETKRDLAWKSQLSFSTASNLCNELKEKGVLSEEKSNDYSVGRNPNKLIFQCHHYCSFCIDFQQEGTMNLAVVDFGNNFRYRERVSIPKDGEISALLERCKDVYTNLCASQEFQDAEFVASGISIPGIFDHEKSVVVNSSVPFLNGQPLAEMVSSKLGLPCYVENEANLCALAVKQSHSDMDNILYLHGSTGLGLGAICDGKLLRGSGGYAAEISCIPLGDPTLRCPYCGKTGCIENDLSLRGMEMLKEVISPEQQKFFQDRGNRLGKLLSLLINLFDPSSLYIGGPSMECYEHLKPYVLTQLDCRSSLNIERGLEICYDPDSVQTIETGICQLIYNNWLP